MNKQPGIYKISSPSGKFYIGSSSNIHSRWIAHRSELSRGKHCNLPLQRAYNKYGDQAIVFEVLTFCSREEPLEIEQKYIDELNPHYNICRIAGNSIGVKRAPFTEEHCRKIGESQKGKKLSHEHRIAIGNIHRGKTLSDYHILRLKECNTGESNHFYGKKHKPETIKKYLDLIIIDQSRFYV